MTTVAQRRARGDARGAQRTRPGRSVPLLAAAGLSVAAGVIHAVAMVDHFDHWWGYGVFFLGATYAQVLWSVWIYRRPDDRRALLAGAIGSLAIAAVWLVTRSVGIPMGPDSGRPESIGAMDTMATLDEIVVAGLVVLLVAPHGRLGRRMGWLAGGQCVRLSIALGSASLFAILLGSHQH